MTAAASTAPALREPDADPEKGLRDDQVAERLRRFGPNLLPTPRPRLLIAIFLKQFASPLIYILFAAAAVSVFTGDPRDALFIWVVLLLNGIIGTAQEYSADRAAAALRRLEQPHATVIRNGEMRDVDSRELVPGDIVLLDAGMRVPADLRLTDAVDLQCDESLLTGESVPIRKRLGEGRETRLSMALAGTTITRGRGRGIVTQTGPSTEMGRIAAEIAKASQSKAPLIIRMERFARMIAYAVGVAAVLVVAAGLMRGIGLGELFLVAVGLAVSAIPEGLPVAISVALSIGMRRMSKANVIVRNMTAVEALGSCTMIATDKTGTLTLNELTVTDAMLPDGTRLVFETGPDPEDCTITSPGPDIEPRRRAARLLTAAALPNEAELVRDGDGWRGAGDTVDVALLTAARKAGLPHEEVRSSHRLLGRIPYEPDRRYAASLHDGGERVGIFVKGAPETLIEMCDRMDMSDGAVAIDRDLLLRQKDELASEGLRVLAFAEGDIDGPPPDGGFRHEHLVRLTFLGLAGMQDPIRPEVPQAIRDCRTAGVEVAMVTGDDPRTAQAIARRAGLEAEPGQIVTGEDIRIAEAEGPEVLDALTRRSRIYARVEPVQKLAIVMSMARNGHFVAVTGDGVNDAPALRHAHVGVAMGRRGTDIAKESADIVLTDDNFASIVKGIEEGRVAYANIRKVVLMLVATGAAEVALFLMAIPLGLPVPLMPVQLLWLNLVTNGLQDVALATEKAEGDELRRPPRAPNEPIFDRLMVRRVLIGMAVMALGGLGVFVLLLNLGYSEPAARNMLLLLFVLFENAQVLNSRSETRSFVHQRIGANPLLLATIAMAQGLHLGAMYVPGLSDVLGLQPVSLGEWAGLLLVAATLMAAMEADKWLAARRATRQRLAMP